ncbi:hypothetical protein Tco_0026742 [Tanacetum coccineum]
MKWYNYGYLEEIEDRREDKQLYKFKEGDFPRLHMHDIEDILLLLVQTKLSNLERDVIFDLGVALRMFSRRIVILKRVEDLQLGVKSYQKKLNITKPRTSKSDISNRTPYTAYNHQSDTQVFTMMMEILLEPTSNKLCGRLSAQDFEDSHKDGRGVMKYYTDTTRLPRSDKVLKLKEFQERYLIQALKVYNQEKYEHVGLKVTSTQDGKRSQVDDKRLCLADDLKESSKITYKTKLKGTSSSLKSKITRIKTCIIC